ncbi:hypothetical protein B0I35DRAFT_405772 [Stachybotrys elegans]|uniref:PWWP domain-containing protein n=1 Tax=Stachybotrys elegans TaxID=80388 RepID=A0A8K0WX53_9HYPO|nr:hypothetical protein B0I35DRAFT_405772 [Stachybotrys elegans]
MAEKSSDKVEAAAPAPDAPEAASSDPQVTKGDSANKEENAKPSNEASNDEEKSAADEPGAAEATDNADDTAEKAEGESDKKDEGDVEMKDAADAADEEPAAPASETPASKSKARRKSAASEPKAKTLNKKNSKARLTHTDAKPGDHFLVKLKGFPAWPAIICDESMLPLALLNTRPVTAAKPDGTYAEAYADGGKRVNDRTFPVMYLSTNEFGWVSNTVLSELTPEKAKDSITEKMRKDLRAAFDLAAEHHSLDHYKEILKQFQEDLAAAAVTPKKSKKGKAKDDDGDVDMDEVPESSKSKSKKRKADEDAATPQRPDSVKKPKIKLNTSSTPKAANGSAASKPKDESAVKAKSKAKKAKDTAEKKPEVVKEAKMTPEERRARKERGLLTRDQQPQESEMKQMSDFIGMLEGFADLEVSIIRATKINKVLKTILKLESIPREEEFNFKTRSQALLDKWNKLMAGDAASGSAAATNGVNGTAEGHSEKAAEANGVSADAEDAKTEAEKTDATDADDAKKAEATKPEKEAGEEKEPAVEPAATTEAVEAAA